MKGGNSVIELKLKRRIGEGGEDEEDDFQGEVAAAGKKEMVKDRRW